MLYKKPGPKYRSMYFLAFFFFHAIIAFSQNSDFKKDSIKKQIQALEITTTIKIDGVLDEAAWSKVKPSPRFTQINPLQGAIPTQDTEIKVLYNEKFLFIGVLCHDSKGKKAIRATDFKRDFDFRTHDLVNIGFDAFNDERNSMTFAINPYGVQRDYLSFDALYYDIDWDGVWQVRTTITEKGWHAEIAIPWQTLRYPKAKKGEQQNWGLNVYRNRRMNNEISAFSEFPRSTGASRMDFAGQLNGLRPPPPGTNIRIQPYLLSSYEKFNNNPNKNNGNQGTDNTFKLGGDIKWALNSNAVLDLTFNTDFAQADIDRPINNTSRINVFFPERRQFFLENASLFAFNAGPGGVDAGGSMRIQPFFSRAIGRADNNLAAPISAGGRYVHRSVKRNYGAMLMRQQKSYETPTTNFFVGRFSENIGKQNRIGGLLTIKNRPDKTNIMGTVDGFFRFNTVHSLNTMFSYSEDTNSGDQGMAGIAQYYYTTNDWKAWWTESVVTEKFRPEMGFVSRSNVIGTTPGVIRFFRKGVPLKKWIRAYEPSLAAEFYHQASSGKLIERQFNIRPLYLNLQNGGYIGYRSSFVKQNLFSTFNPLGIKISEGTYNYSRHRFFASSDPSKKLSLNFSADIGSYFNGDLQAYDMKLKFVPIPHISLLGGVNRNRFVDVGEELETKNVDLFSIEGRFALNPRLQLTAYYYQNTLNKKYNYNIRFSWEYKPLSYVYLVFNQQEFNNEFTLRQTDQQAIVKLSYLKQF